MFLDSKQLSNIVKGTLIGDENFIFSHFSTDSREVKEGSLFTALKGKKTDGHLFCNDAFNRGAKGGLLQEACGVFPVEIIVENTYQALIELGKYLSSLNQIYTIGVCGSSGKTTTKEMIKNILSLKFKVSATPGNMNTDIGIPLYLLNEELDKDLRLVEYGTQKVGDAKVLLDIIKPQGAVVTTLGLSHVEHFKTLEIVREEEAGLIVKSLPSTGWVVMNADDHLVNNLDCICKKITYGFKGEEFRLISSVLTDEGTKVQAFTPMGKVEFVLKHILGEHLAMNALSALAVGYINGVNIDDCLKVLSEFQPIWGRMEKKIIKGATIIADYYNSNPLSIKAALKVFKELKGKRKILVLGEMRELGEYSDKEHEKVRTLLSTLKYDYLLAVGEKTKIILEGSTNGEYFSSAKEAGLRLKQILKSGDLVLIKGSRGVGLEATEKEILE